MIYKGIERLCSDLSLLRNRVEDYGSVVSAYLSLKKPASLCRHLTHVGQEQDASTEQVELTQSHHAMVPIDLDALQERHESVIQRIANLGETLRLAQKEKCQLKRDLEAKSLELIAVEDEIHVKSKALADRVVVPTLLPDDVIELERHKQAMLDMQSSLSLDTWMDIA